MANRKIDLESMRLINMFENITRAHVKDMFTFKDRLTFLVGEGEVGKAIGKNRVNLLKLEKLLKQRIRIVEFHPDKLKFIISLLYPLKVMEIDEEDGVVTIKGPDTKTKGLMIGSRAQNLRATEEIVRRYFDCKEIKVT